MILTFEYRIKPNPSQAQSFEQWLELLRRHWNYALGQHLDWLRQTRCDIDRCNLISEPIGERTEKVNYYTQSKQSTKSPLHVQPRQIFKKTRILKSCFLYPQSQS